jgi:hypothetical protein
MRKRLRHPILAIVLVFCLLIAALPAFSQSYSFTVDQLTVDVFYEADGSARIIYQYLFSNDDFAPPIEFVDVGIPFGNFDLSRVSASANGQALTHIAPSEYVKDSFEVGLGTHSIPPGQKGTVTIVLGWVGDILYEDDLEDAYASARFMPSYFDSSLVHGNTDLTVTFHLPPGVKPEEPRYHEAPRGWPSDVPETYLDEQGRVAYSWRNPNANAYSKYEFGASFPLVYVPAESIQTPSLITINEELLYGICCFGGILAAIIGFIALGVYSSRRRKLDYLPPKISIEGHGIKRGLTAVESAVLLETPLDRVLTMILFSVIKKGAAKVIEEEPLKIERLDAEVKLREYEEGFLKVLVDDSPNKRRAGLQNIVVDLVKSVQKKMKGFSLKETRDYYKAIMRKAWEQVEAAETPEIRSERYAEGLEWTMLDDKFDDRTQQVFRTGPVYLPPWWWYYRPSTSVPRPSTAKISTPSSGGRSISLPTLPGADFAASVVTGVQSTASSLVTNLVGFTNGVTKTTNPPPPPSTTRSSFSRGGGGGGCACACACAGCACACAGGGR